MQLLLDITPDNYSVAAAAIGDEVGDVIALTVGELVGALQRTYGMAGSDSGGQAWGDSYDAGVWGAIKSATDVTNACYQLAALLDQSGLNYAGAEAASTGGGPADVRRTHWARMSAGSFGDVVPSVGIGVPEPPGWSTLAHAIGYLWPDGHQDLLRAAQSAWTQASDRVAATLPALDRAFVEVMLERAPDSDEASIVLDAMRDHVNGLAGGFREIGAACGEYANHLDTAHHDIIGEIKSFLEWTAGIEAAGGLLSFFTFGLAEAAAQVGEAAEIARVASAIKTMIEAVIAAARSVAEAIDAAASRVGAIAEQLQSVLARRVEEARLLGVDRGEISVPNKFLAEERMTTQTAGGATTDEGLAVDRLEVHAQPDIGHAAIHKFPTVRKWKSQFFDDVDLASLTDTSGITPLVQNNGRSLYVMRAQRTIGVDRVSRQPTDVYTVIRAKNGRLITMYPGTSEMS